MSLKKNDIIIKNKSPLRYPGGKTRACKYLDLILNNNFNLEKYKNIVSPFFGGGSFEFYLQNKYNLKIIANDKFKPLYTFWNTCKSPKKKMLLCSELYECLGNINKEIFTKFRKIIINEKIDFIQAKMYFIINRCSFSGSTLSGGFSLESSKKRFTESSINRVKSLNLINFEIYNFDFKEFIDKNKDDVNLLFLDPPYYLKKKSKLYGNNGDMHENFDHTKLYNCVCNKKNWLMTYNNCEFIRNLYKDFIIIDTQWSYGMNKSKKSSEIVIVSLKKN